MIKSKIRWYDSEHGLRNRPIKVWKLGPIVLRRKPMNRLEAERQDAAR